MRAFCYCTSSTLASKGLQKDDCIMLGATPTFSHLSVQGIAHSLYSIRLFLFIRSAALSPVNRLYEHVG